MKDVAAGVARFLPTARRSIHYCQLQFPRLDPDEIESVVMFALYQCVVRYDPARGSFRALFQPRALGAVRDAARRGDVLTRPDREHLRDGEALRADGTPIVKPLLLSLDDEGEGVGSPESDARGYHEIYGADDPALDGDGLTVTALVAGLEPRDRLVIFLRYYGDVSYEEIGELLGVSQTRVLQVATRAVARMRTAARSGGRSTLAA